MSELPDDLADLERSLAARPQPQPNAALRQRVLAAVRDELPRETNSMWRFAATLAATVLLGANLSLSVAINTDWRQEADDEITMTATRIRQLDPELSEQEARRQALLLQARARLVPAPAVRPPVGRVEAWAAWKGD